MASSPWLSAAEQRAWVGHRAVARLLDTALDRQLQADAGISHVTYIILSVLSDAPDRTLSMSTLANFTNSSQSRTTHAVARLEERGWVTRAKPATSRRMVNATLTDVGFEVLRRAAPGHAAMVKHLVFDRLTPDQVRQLDDVDRIILAGLAEHGLPVESPLRPRDAQATGTG